jgi:hypothetical protein
MYYLCSRFDKAYNMKEKTKIAVEQVVYLLEQAVKDCQNQQEKGE